MADITFGTIRRSRYISRKVYEHPSEHNNAPTWDAKPGFEDLIQKFLRNQVVMDFTISNLADSPTRTETDEKLDHAESMINEYCDSTCTGFWSRYRTYHRNGSYDVNTNQYQYHNTASGKIIIYFENEADLEPFLKNCATVLKLSV